MFEKLIQVIRGNTVFSDTATQRDLTACRAATKGVIQTFREFIEGMDNCYGFVSGGAIPRFEEQYNGFEEARKAILDKLKEMQGE